MVFVYRVANSQYCKSSLTVGMTPHRITSSPCSFQGGPCSFVSVPSFLRLFEILRRLFWGAYFHNYVSEFMKKKTFPGRSNRDTLTHIVHDIRQVEISFLGMPQIAHFQVEKWKSSLPWEGGHPPCHTLPPLGRYAPSGLVASLPRKECAPQMFWLITPLFVGLLSGFGQLHVFFSAHTTMKSWECIVLAMTSATCSEGILLYL